MFVEGLRHCLAGKRSRRQNYLACALSSPMQLELLPQPRSSHDREDASSQRSNSSAAEAHACNLHIRPSFVAARTP